MPTTKNEKLFLAYSLIFGVIAGLCISAILQAIALPSITGFLLTVQEYADFTHLATKVDQVQIYINLGIGAGFVYLMLLLPILNPNITVGLLKQPPKLIKLGVYILVAFIVTIGLSLRLESFFGNMNSSLFMKIIGVAVPVVWWAILGQIGIAGDFSTWQPKHSDIRTCILLAVTGYFIFIILTLTNNWGFLWFFTLVSEGLDGSGELSAAGFKWLQGGLIFLSTCTSVALAATIIAVAPVRRELHARTDKLILPIGLVIGLALLLSGGYYYASSQYDLDKMSLAEAIGAPNPTEPANQLSAILLSDSITSSPWDMGVQTYSMTGSSTLLASEENIELLNNYLNSHPQSIHRYNAEDTLVKSRFNLWDNERATTAQQQTQTNLIQRLIFLNRLSCLPITDSNRNFLVDYEDDSKWWVGSKAALRLASASIHFNEFEKARKWLKVAQEQGASDEALARIVVPEHANLDRGKIIGSISINQPVTIGLFRANDDNDVTVTLDTTYLSLNLVDSIAVNSSTAFSFTNIGTGKYFLALKYTGDIALITINKQDLIKLDRDQKMVNVGMITIEN